MTESAPLRVGLVEEHLLLREAMRSLLQAGGDIVVVGEASGGDDVLEMIDANKPNLVLLMMEGGGERDVALLDRLPEISDRAHALVVTGDRDQALHAQAIEFGARGVVVKDEPAAVLVKAVHKIHAGEIWLDRARYAAVLNQVTRRRIDADPAAAQVGSLTVREREIVRLVTEGLTNKDIAERLYISEATARNHLTSILDKLDLSDRFQLTVYAFRRGLVACPQTPAMRRVAATMSSGPLRVTSNDKPAQSRKSKTASRARRESQTDGRKNRS
jgi:two-component system, NarL family, nitrate/nitrite response regulator NarL